MNAFQVHRNSLAWILAAQVAVIAPHVMRLPVWTTAICAFCIFWRVMVYQGRWSYPGVIVKLTFVVASVAGLGFGYGTFLGVDPWVGLFIVMFSLKLLEMRGRRDAFVVVLLGYFVALTLFLYQTGIPWTLYALVACTMITAGLEYLKDPRGRRYTDRMSYRAGFSYDSGFLRVSDVAIDSYQFSLGLGLPLGKSSSSLNISYTRGFQGTVGGILVEENFNLVNINITLSDIWFLKRYYD